MANEKDLAEKILFDMDDVFADIVNVLLFKGKELLKPEDLAATEQISQLKIGKNDHQQQRDVSKLWMNGRVRFALIGLENQTEAEKLMPMRAIGYDGASYKEQVVHDKEKDRVKWRPYPVITIVLYFGKTHWNEPKSLKELFGPLPEEIAPYVNDYRIRVFEIAFLTPEEVAMFKSDFRIVADYFVHSRIDKNYKGSPEEIRHVDALLKLMSALTNDNRYENQINDWHRKGGPVAMSEIVNNFIEQGAERAKRESICAVADAFSVKELSKRFAMSEEEILKILAEAGITPKSEG